MARISRHTIQGDDAAQGDYSSSGLVLSSLNRKSVGISLYVADATAQTVSIKTARGSTINYPATQGFIQTPLFTEILAAGTSSANLIVYLTTSPAL